MKHLQEQYEGNYISISTFDAEDNKPFKFAICVEVTDLDSACGEPGYLITVDAAKLPKYLTLKQRQSVARCMSIQVKQITATDISQYGLSASFDSYVVLTESEVISKLAEIDKQLPAYGMLCGFYFDKPLNRLGNTGWEFLNGNI